MKPLLLFAFVGPILFSFCYLKGPVVLIDALVLFSVCNDKALSFSWSLIVKFEASLKTASNIEKKIHWHNDVKTKKAPFTGLLFYSVLC